MKQILSKINCAVILIGILIFLGNIEINAQGPFTYDTPLGKKIHTYSLSPQNTYSAYAQEWGGAATGFDGLTVVAMINILPNVKSEVFQFYNRSNEKHLTVFYEDGTLNLRRVRPRNSVGNFEYYDYVLYDRMFESGYDTWEVRLYFTSDFLWVQTTPVTSSGNEKSYLSPIYFGLDNMLQKDNMYDFINASDSNTRIVIGSNFISNGVKQVAVYAFQYVDLRKDIQDNFCNPFTNGVYDGEEEY